MPYKLMFALAACCGLRSGEIMGLRVEDIDLERKILTIGQIARRGIIQSAKNRGSETTLPIPESLCDLLRGSMPAGRLLFVNRNGRPFTAERVIKQQLRPILEKLGIPRAGFHAFRHMHTTLLVDSGASIKTAQRQLRLADPRITLETHAHVVEPSHRKAVEDVAKYLN